MILTIGNTKGGVGKTTIAVNVAIARALAGKDVWLIDGDRQANSSTAMAIRAGSNVTPLIACSQYTDGVQLRSQVKLQASKYDDVIIDVGGRDSTALRAALVISNVLLVPFQPRSYDVWALSDMVELINEARSIRDDLQVYAMLNFADPASSRDNIEAKEAVCELPQFTYLDLPFGRRKAYSNASGQGLCVYELNPKDQKACSELNKLINVLY